MGNDTSAALQYKVSDFEGPLDMLLQLIAKHKMDICDIEIAVLLEQYMEQIKNMQSGQMEVSSEFLEMASRLVYIKSVSLLPKHEEAQELKKELEGQLIEYQECRRMAAELAKMATYDIYVKPPSKVKFDMTYTRVHQPQEIAKAFAAAAGRGKSKLPPPREAFSGIIERKIVSVSSRVVYVLRQLWDGTPIKYRNLFKEGSPKSELVATFLAVLELVKNSRIRIDGDGDSADVRLIRKENRVEEY